MKISTLRDKLAPVLPLLRCPLCRAAFDLTEGSLRCENGHVFDLSAKGYVNLAPGHDQVKEKYGADLFDSRSRVFRDGFYIPVAQAVETMIAGRVGASPFALADVGCGEGYYSRSIAARFPDGTILGLDLSRDGILRAAKEPGQARWLVADLKRLPIRDGGLDLILDVLTPADYAAFKAALKPGGTLIKVVPGEDYLREIREAVRSSLRVPEYDNRRVIRLLEENAEALEQATVRKTFSLSPEQSDAFLRMTPLTFSVPEEVLEKARLDAITIHMEVFACTLK